MTAMMNARPVLMSIAIADDMGWTDRLTRRTETTGVLIVTEDELLAKCPPGCSIEWGYPDTLGRFTPTIHTPTVGLPVTEVPA